MTRESLTFTTINGKVVVPSDKEVERVRKSNFKAAPKMNPARNAWSYWATFNAKAGKAAKGVN